ncbi:hypothetical protein [uncultured Sunxiuqinia sp.]|uniref:hypothetical protein n=1 Tax=uncultured Sunxiuqinia sp. TaxID=1573825 RepID=UPI002AA73F68|nr:hypothetical protein [uncultured Sunxiuqinia sp.]
MVWINISVKHEFWYFTGQIYLAIAFSIIAGYIIYFMTSEYPKIKERIELNPTLDYYIDKIRDTQYDILALMGYPQDRWSELEDYTLDQLHADFKVKIGERIDDEIRRTGNSREDVFDKIMKEFGSVLDTLNVNSTEHFKYFHNYLTFGIIDILKQIEIHTKNIFGSTRGIIAFSEAIGLGGVTKNDHGLIALELASVFLEFGKLREQVFLEVKKYSKYSRF